MKVTYDQFANAAYIYLGSDVVRVVDTLPCETDGLAGDINFDLDENGLLVGIEILNAKSVLPKDVLTSAAPPKG